MPDPITNKIDPAVVLAKIWEPLKQGSKIYALLDAARDPTIHQKLSALDTSSCRPLFPEPLATELLTVAPYLVQRGRTTDFMKQLIAEGWGNCWGFFVESSVAWEDLQKHLQGMLLVKDEASRSLHFRFYDPRVFRVYLPACNAAELSSVFGPVDRYCIEGETANQLVNFSIANSKLVSETVGLAS